MSIVPASALRIDWTNKDAVIKLCKQLGKGNCVFKVEGRANYNIGKTIRHVGGKHNIIHIQ